MTIIVVVKEREVKGKKLVRTSAIGLWFTREKSQTCKKCKETTVKKEINRCDKMWSNSLHTDSVGQGYHIS
jgi:hypothetical protein